MLAALLLAFASPALAAYHVELRDSGFCIDVPNGQADQKLQLWSCIAGNTNQAWSLGSTSRAPGNPTTIAFGSTGLCVGIEEADSRDGAAVGLVPCRGSAITTWRNSPYSLCLWGHDGLCIDCTGEPSDGAQLVLTQAASTVRDWSLLNPA